MELRRTVQQDVERTFPDISLFRSLDVQRGLTNALFVWAQLNADVGYRQGMHELAAILWLAFSNDALKSEGAEGTEGARDEQIMRTVLSAEHIEHDTYALFEILMRNARSWYEWRETTVSGVFQLPHTFIFVTESDVLSAYPISLARERRPDTSPSACTSAYCDQMRKDTRSATNDRSIP